jgi:hypothetical protein
MNVLLNNCRDGPTRSANPRFLQMDVPTRLELLGSECRRILSLRGSVGSQVTLSTEMIGKNSLIVSALVSETALLAIVHEALDVLALDADLETY